MKLVRRASNQELHTGRHNHNKVHWYYIDSFEGDYKLKLVEDLLATKYPNDQNITVEEGCGSTFYIDIDQVKQFKEDYKTAKKQISVK